MNQNPNWVEPKGLPGRSYTCAYCGRAVGPDRGYWARPENSHFLYICSLCSRPTYFEPDGTQYPGVAYGTEVEHLPEAVGRLYDEARNAMSVNAFTAAVMTCRKVLMNVAVTEGAKPGKSFADYVKWLSGKGYVPTKGGAWVDRIRKKGNEANHEIPDISRSDAEDILSFTEMLLKVNYEMPARAAPAASQDEDANE